MKRFAKQVAQSAIAKVAPLTWAWSRQPRLLVLMYHRVLPPEHPDRPIEQPGMFVSPRTLQMHIEVLRRYFELVHLDDWLRAQAAGERLPKLACALTFDDGWRDNYDHAFPILSQNAAPATIFIVSTLTGTYREFWPNRLARLLSQPHARSLPAQLEQLLAPAIPRNRDSKAPSSEQLDAAINLAKQISEEDIQRLLDQAEGGEVARQRALLSEEELQTMSASGLIRYGSHTRTHYRCRPGAPHEVLEREIGDSRREIEAYTAAPAELFCYPNGDTTPAAVDLVSRHYRAAVTTQRGWYTSGLSRYLIPRVGVHEDISDRTDSFLARISGWL